ncbi:MAG: NAD-dependent protein deacylase [Caldithrix sp.]|nr:NAD-dependent protein deacylase [Caldithrix sp.]
MFNEKILNRFKNSTQIAVLTGAGISAESGVPTFRGKDGLWNNYDPQQLASPQALSQMPETFWEFYNWRRKKLLGVKPNLGHYALVDMEKLFDDFALITQNVDNLHREAGNTNIYELHGNIARTRCEDCQTFIDQPMSFTLDEKVPRCPHCSGLLRPDVVLFGEMLPQKAFRDAQEASATCEIFLSIGTSSLVEPAASLPYIAKANGAFLLEINPEKTPLSASADEVVQGKAGEVLPNLVIQIEKLK